jgi:hypothetical protein
VIFYKILYLRENLGNLAANRVNLDKRYVNEYDAMRDFSWLFIPVPDSGG